MRLDNVIKASFIIVGLLIAYAVGFGHGQSSAYEKMNDGRTLMDIYMGDDN